MHEVSVTLRFPSIAEAVAFLSARGEQPAASVVIDPNVGTTGGTAAAEAVVEEATKKRRPRKTVEDIKEPEAAAPQSQQTAEAVAASTPNPATFTPADDAKPLTLDDVRAALQSVAAAKGMPAAQVVVSGAGVTRISELKPEQYAGFIATCQEAAK